jgi:hypothetical protein
MMNSSRLSIGSDKLSPTRSSPEESGRSRSPSPFSRISPKLARDSFGKLGKKLRYIFSENIFK